MQKNSPDRLQIWNPNPSPNKSLMSKRDKFFGILVKAANAFTENREKMVLFFPKD
jgi:hypothetical protein